MIIKNTVKILVVCGLAFCTFFACKNGATSTAGSDKGKAAADKRPLGYAGKDLYEAPVGLLTPMGKNSNPVFNEGMSHYAKKDFEQAIKIWSGIRDRTFANDTLSFYMGSAHYAIKKYSKASTFYLKAKTVKDSKFYSMTHWFLALCSYKLGVNDLAVQYLENCDNPLKERLLVDIEQGK